MPNQFSNDTMRRLEVQPTHVGAGPDSDGAKPPPLPEAPYRPSYSDSSPNDAPYEPYAKKPEEHEPRYEPYKDI